ncbi:hypothetical protein [Marinimicrobium koreense]|uniref:hypothetical protein n=1 Tax=Marinimicrobium koreense TaxID=306545 RepID=UPI001FE28976|nr:hypothetical protein [Marinimicrobium koreense]
MFIEEIFQLWQEAAEDLVKTDMNQGASSAPLQTDPGVAGPIGTVIGPSGAAEDEKEFVFSLSAPLSAQAKRIFRID